MPRRTQKKPENPRAIVCPVCETENFFAEVGCIECGTPLHFGTKGVGSLKSVQSSNIDAIGYNRRRTTLYVRFLNGGLYGYFGVSKDVFDEFLAAESKGKFLHAHIKSTYEYEKIY